MGIFLLFKGVKNKMVNIILVGIASVSLPIGFVGNFVFQLGATFQEVFIINSFILMVIFTNMTFYKNRGLISKIVLFPKEFMMHEEVRKAVCDANIELQRQKLVIYSWGNVSGIDRSPGEPIGRQGVVAIKPSGVTYDELTPDKMVLLDLDGNVIEGALKPSSDTLTHLELYRNFKNVGGVCHTHSPNATIWSQACTEIPCFGTTHADYFYGPIPVTKTMTKEQIQTDYELNTGKVIVARFTDLDPVKMPAVLVANHGPFTWGETAADAVEAAVVLEQVAKIALGTLMVNPNQTKINKPLLDKHYLRKHGKDAYYGQK